MHTFFADRTRCREAQEVKDGLNVEIDVEMPSPIHALDCTSDHEMTSYINGTQAHLTVTHLKQRARLWEIDHVLSSSQFNSNKHASSTGLVLLIGQQKASDPQAVVEIDREAGTSVAMVSFIAELEQLRDADIIAEIIFVVDRRSRIR